MIYFAIIAVLVIGDVFLREWNYRSDRKAIRERIADITAGGKVGVVATEVGHRRVQVEVFRWKTPDEVLSVFTKPLSTDQVAPWLDGFAAAVKLAGDGPVFVLSDTGGEP